MYGANDYRAYVENLDESVYHHGVKGQKWGKRRYQNPDGSLTPEGKSRLLKGLGAAAGAAAVGVGGYMLARHMRKMGTRLPMKGTGDGKASRFSNIYNKAHNMYNKAYGAASSAYRKAAGAAGDMYRKAKGSKAYRYAAGTAAHVRNKVKGSDAYKYTTGAAKRAYRNAGEAAWKVKNAAGNAYNKAWGKVSSMRYNKKRMQKTH